MSGSFVFVAIPISILIVLGLLISIPLCRAYWEGLLRVRDPSVRSTPRDPWETMTEALQQRLRWAVIPAKLSPLLLCLLPVDWWLRNINPTPEAYGFTILVVSIAALIFGQGHLILLFTILLAPRSRSLKALRVASVLSGAALYTIGLVVLFLALGFAGALEGSRRDASWLVLDLYPDGYDPGFGNVAGFLFTLPLYLNFMAALAARVVWLRFRRKGDAWFRFDD